MGSIRRLASGWCVAAALAVCVAAQTPVDPPGQTPGNDPNGPTPTGPAGGTWNGPGDTVPAGAGGTSGNGPGGTGGGTTAPGTQGPVIPGTTTPMPPGSPVGRPPSVPTVSVFDLGPDQATWEIWWNLNRDRFLAIKAAIYAADSAAAPEGTGLARRRPDARAVADRVLPVLIAIVERESDPALVAEALLALARADRGRDVDDAQSQRVVERITAALAHKQLLVAESAAMALAARGASRSVPLLAEIVADSAAGRAAVGRDQVPTRLRSIAALSMGLAAARGRVDVARYAAHALSRPLEKSASTPLELAAACAAGLGLLDLGGAAIASDADLPASASSAALARFLEGVADDTDRDQLVRAQAAASVGRVAGPSGDATRAQAIVWAIGVGHDAARPTMLRQGAAIALGRLGRPTVSEPDRAAHAALVALARDTDRLVRGLAWLARGEIGARARVEAEKEPALAIQAALLAEHAEAKSGVLGYLSLALGVLAHDSALVAAADGNRALKDGWPRAKSPSDESAIGLALGLRLDVGAAPALAERFVKEGDASARASLALGLGLAGSTSSLTALRSTSGPDNHPLVIRDSAIARALLGDASVGPEMLSLLGSTRSLLAADYAADALGAMGDGHNLDGLVALARDEATPTARRARVVRALGAVADASLLPWNEPLRADGHYGAAFEAWSAVVLR